MLARREHSEKEIRRKLSSNSFDAEDIDTVLSQLKSEGLQSDSRFAEAFVHSRVLKGYGPAHISQELRQRGVADDIVDISLNDAGLDWLELLAQVREKKFGGRLPKDYQEQARQSRFLHYRGFSGEQIRRLFNKEIE